MITHRDVRIGDMIETENVDGVYAIVERLDDDDEIYVTYFDVRPQFDAKNPSHDVLIWNESWKIFSKIR